MFANTFYNLYRAFASVINIFSPLGYSNRSEPHLMSSPQSKTYFVAFKQGSAEFEPELTDAFERWLSHRLDKVAIDRALSGDFSKHRIALRVPYDPESDGKAVAIARAEAIRQHLRDRGIERSRIAAPEYIEYIRREDRPPEVNDNRLESRVRFDPPPRIIKIRNSAI